SAESGYCKVVAADDWIFPQCLELMVRLAEEHPAVAIVGAYHLVGSKLDPSGLPFPLTVAAGRTRCRGYPMDGHHVFGVPSSLLFRAEIVRGRDPFFSEPHLHADLLACLESLDGWDFGFVHEVLSFERVSEDSQHAQIRANNLYLAEKLDALVKYGPRYLDDAELRQCIASHMFAYYRYLGAQSSCGGGEAFWRIPRERPAEAGYPLRPARVLAHAACHGIETAARHVARRLLQRL